MLTYDGFDEAQARTWIRESLDSGQLVARGILEYVSGNAGRVCCTLPSLPVPLPLALRGGCLDPLQERWWGNFHADDDLDKYVGRRALVGDRCLLVEDELARRGDRIRDRVARPPFSFIGDRMLHWADLDAGFRPTDVLSWGSAPGVTNAFLTASGGAALGLIPEEELDDLTLARIVAAVDVVIVSAFDGALYAMWELPPAS